jgi:hypothetical protein
VIQLNSNQIALDIEDGEYVITGDCGGVKVGSQIQLDGEPFSVEHIEYYHGCDVFQARLRAV